MAGRKRTKPPSYKITIYLPVVLMEAFDRYLYERKSTMTETIETLLREHLKKEGYLKEGQDYERERNENK